MPRGPVLAAAAVCLALEFEGIAAGDPYLGLVDQGGPGLTDQAGQ